MLAIIKASILNILFPPACLECGRDGTWVCSDCLRLPPSIYLLRPTPDVDQLLSLGSYDHRVLEKSIQRIKYHGGQVAAEPLSHELGKRFSSQLQADVIVPVPLHSSRERQRGFNQSDLLAVTLGKKINLPVKRLVQRTRATVPQVTLNEIERHTNVADAFKLVAGLEIIPKRVIIVDDVFTTGATISAVARVLRTAGTRSITAVTVAKG